MLLFLLPKVSTYLARILQIVLITPTKWVCSRVSAKGVDHNADGYTAICIVYNPYLNELSSGCTLWPIRNNVDRYSKKEANNFYQRK